MKRRHFIGIGLSAAIPTLSSAGEIPRLPLSTTFKGQDKFQDMVRRAARESWRELPIGERMIKFAREMRGTPYKSYTLEIDDRIEAPSVNLYGLDCWTFFEISLGLARMIGQTDRTEFTPRDLLYQIEFTRYRAGCCRGHYLDRIHYLAEWYVENDARGTCDNITRNLGGAERIHDRQCQEMTKLWKSYRYLRSNPSLLEPMGDLERKISALKVYYIPKSRVARIEPKLRNGDILGIATNHTGGFCSHVGLAVRTGDGVMRFMHASSNYKRVVIDKSVSGYLNEFSSHAGVIVGRPLEVSKTVMERHVYLDNLRKLTA